jgi:hypothetical protein
MLSTALLITPSAYHRFVFRRHDKEQLLETYALPLGRRGQLTKRER